MLRTLLRQRHWQNYTTFCREYDKAARRGGSLPHGQVAEPRAAQPVVDRGAQGAFPTPITAVSLKAMFPGTTAAELFLRRGRRAASWRLLVHAVVAASGAHGGSDRRLQQPVTRTSHAAHPPSALFDNAQSIDAAGAFAERDLPELPRSPAQAPT